jgi:hypothetical protein
MTPVDSVAVLFPMHGLLLLSVVLCRTNQGRPLVVLGAVGVTVTRGVLVVAEEEDDEEEEEDRKLARNFRGILNLLIIRDKTESPNENLNFYTGVDM